MIVTKQTIMNEDRLSDNEQNEQIRSNISSGFVQFFQGILDFFLHSMNMSEGADKEKIVSEITQTISFRGHVAWILVCSILIASVGLNLNSTAVIIGAMLISPLMGPILGIGLGVATYDRALLSDALKNFALAVIISLVASAAYFWISPLKELTPEMLSRTNPSILDAVIALFGGLAGIIAVSRKEMSNAIPGVAIATALMPPLCTAGYGISVMDGEIFFEAFYLFFLNSVLIFIPTWVVIRYLGLDVKHEFDAKTEKRYKLYIISFVLIILIPSGVLFYGMIKKSFFERDAREFFEENFKYKDSWITGDPDLNYADTMSTITIKFNDNVISKQEEKELKKKLESKIENCRLVLNQPKDKTDEIAGKLSQEVKVGILEEIYEKNEAILKNREDRIRLLEQKVIEAENNNTLASSLDQLIQSAYIEYIESYKIAEIYNLDSTGVKQQNPAIMIKWKKNLSTELKNTKSSELLKTAKGVLKASNIELIEL